MQQSGACPVSFPRTLGPRARMIQPSSGDTGLIRRCRRLRAPLSGANHPSGFMESLEECRRHKVRARKYVRFFHGFMNLVPYQPVCAPGVGSVVGAPGGGWVVDLDVESLFDGVEGNHPAPSGRPVVVQWTFSRLAEIAPEPAAYSLAGGTAGRIRSARECSASNGLAGDPEGRSASHGPPGSVPGSQRPPPASDACRPHPSRPGESSSSFGIR